MHYVVMHMLNVIVGRAQAGCLLLQRLLSNAMVTKMVQNCMQAKSGWAPRWFCHASACRYYPCAMHL